MTSRLATAFNRLRSEGRGGLVTYLTAGDPDAARSAALLEAVAGAGADVLEVGVPFSDPLADGPVIQRATERALAGGMTLRGTLQLIRRVRPEVDAPIVLFTYGNPVLRMGIERFAREAADAGVDGVLVLDYPVEESGALRGAIVESNMDPIFLISPTTTDSRIHRSAELGRGFLYLISRLGVTGVRDELPQDVPALAARVRASTDLPLALGFGIARPEHVADACKVADAAVVGSALVNVVAEHGSAADLCGRVSEYVRWLKSAL
jgi:tryptophan synthase alpha chain